ncbi:MAG: ABC transporter substrate-binding protein [Gammaproteobacteria bacterium]|nr:ABC transporter substrate-binding protein [Gammaproteobacteria bacterium]MDE0715524.1 ABC transporter substrate-binding protein [Gammaproteobacteria bacterium]MXY66234.1 ABC transporter substrate-binding protein [Gammaproteobacteria bacterium]MYG65293.1 ABC transporter substrate-binding protein [Gammaproteobacteria bacterium]MYH89652.1 ABC transporter substrate-binding protein [Gammaproteobacteria bacterium]
MNDKVTPKFKPGEPGYSDLSAYDKGLVEKAVRGGHSRRDVLKLMAVTGVSLATAQNLLATGGRAMAMTPKKGGFIRMASNLHGPDDQLDPPLFTSTIDYTRGRAIYNSLVQHNDDLTTRGDLAETVEPNADASEWTLKLRKGVEFHDGTPFTADDVIYSMNRHMGDDSTSVIKSVLASIQEWKKVGSHEVKCILNTPNADLPTLLGLFQTKIVKNGTTGDGIGTGPYKMDSFEPGVKSVHSRNENYFREGAWLDGMEITAITDPVARVNALIAGDVQMSTVIDPKAFRQIESADGVTLLSTPAALQVGICVLKNAAPGENDDFVKGMQHIQDRERIVKRILKGKGTVGNDTPISSAHGPDFCHELPQREFDPDKAKHHFEKSGFKTAELYVAPVMAGIEDVCLLAQANCAKIGFDLKLKKVPTDGYWGAVWMREPLNVVTWNMRPTAQSQMAIQFGPGAAWNDTYWNNERMGELLQAVLSQTDPVKRHDMMCEMQTLIHEGSGMVIPAFSNINDGIADNIMGMPKVPLGQLGACEWPEFVWLA